MWAAAYALRPTNRPRAIDWQVPWVYYPQLNFNTLEDVFTVTPAQSAPLLDPSSDALEVASLKVRLLGIGGQANQSTGIISGIDVKLNNGPPVAAQQQQGGHDHRDDRLAHGVEDHLDDPERADQPAGVHREVRRG